MTYDSEQAEFNSGMDDFFNQLFGRVDNGVLQLKEVKKFIPEDVIERCESLEEEN